MDKLNTRIVEELRETLQRCLDHKLSEMASWTDGFDFELLRGGTYTNTDTTFKVYVKLRGSKTQTQRDLETFGEMDNLDLTKIAKLDGKDFSLSGFRRKARTKPYLIQDLKNGGEYIITTEVAKKYFGKGEVA